jgi:integrase
MLRPCWFERAAASCSPSCADAGPDDLSGHSLRAGFVTEAKKHGADDAAIMDQTGHSGEPQGDAGFVHVPEVGVRG